MTSDEKDEQPASQADVTAAPTASQDNPATDDLAAQIQRTHDQIVATLTTGYKDVEEAMRIAEEAVTVAVHGATKAVDMAQQAAKKPDA
ncbi:hypothetical protein [Dyella nitratireducens]|nr:hypothetical protein [Dyella nitratireducens]